MNLKKLGVKNVQLPIFIKASDFVKEIKHIGGFAPEIFLYKSLKLLDTNVPLTNKKSHINNELQLFLIH